MYERKRESSMSDMRNATPKPLASYVKDSEGETVFIIGDTRVDDKGQPTGLTACDIAFKLNGVWARLRYV